MPWSWLNTEYSIHQVQHHPKMDSLLLPASFPSLGGCCCTQLSTFPQFQVNQWIELQLAWRLPPNCLVPSTPPILLDHSLQVHRQTRSITTLQLMSEFTQSQSPVASPTSLNHILKVHAQTCPITVSERISKLTLTWPPSASLSSLDLGLLVHLSTRLITASKYIVSERLRVDGDTGVTKRESATRSTYSGDSWVDRYHLLSISSGSTQLRGFSWPGSIISSHFPSGVSHSALNKRLQMLLWLCSTTNCGLIDCMYIYRDT